LLQPAARVRSGSVISLNERARKPSFAAGACEVLFADAHVLVVAKPAGISTVPYEGSENDTLDRRVRAWMVERGLARRGARPPLGIVHRIDKETTGLVVFTRTWLAKQSLGGQFRRHAVHRRYVAIAHGDVRSLELRSVLVDDRGDGLRGSAKAPATAAQAGGREAVTYVERVEGLSGATLMACRLLTGRTHQIRIHLSEAGHPLVGERVYVRNFAGPLIEAPRLMLHAAELGFTHPVTGREMRWDLALPEDMEEVVRRLRGMPHASVAGYVRAGARRPRRT
jgi:23S rRNA pseudouridine1911/1915/1917 synthase